MDRRALGEGDFVAGILNQRLDHLLVALAAPLKALMERRSSIGLIATDETPADDPIDAPFHFSSHVLLWRVLRELDETGADRLRDLVRRHFATGEMYAYAIAGAKGDGAVRYHDANDLPTVFAPGWRFVRSTDPRWRATIDFAW